MIKRSLLALTLACSSAYADAPIDDRLKALRTMSEAERSKQTAALAHEIAALPLNERFSPALRLAGLSTEGDPGRETMQLATDLLVGVLPQAPDKASADQAYETLAILARYEHMRVPPAVTSHPTFVSVTNGFVADDRNAEHADFAIPDRDGKLVTKKSLRGKVVLLNFWATWCPPCRGELPGLESIAQKYGDKLVVLAVTDEDADKVTAFLGNKASHLHVMFDPKGDAKAAFHVRGIPHTFAFDREGKLAAIAVDGRSQAEFDAMVKKAGL